MRSEPGAERDCEDFPPRLDENSEVIPFPKNLKRGRYVGILAARIPEAVSTVLIWAIGTKSPMNRRQLSGLPEVLQAGFV